MWCPLMRKHLFNHLLWSVFQSSLALHISIYKFPMEICVQHPRIALYRDALYTCSLTCECSSLLYFFVLRVSESHSDILMYPLGHFFQFTRPFQPHAVYLQLNFKLTNNLKPQKKYFIYTCLLRQWFT